MKFHPIFVLLAILFTIRSEAQTNNNLISCGNQKEDDLLIFVEQMPVFDGDINYYLEKNLMYPKSALENKIQGRVLVQFIVEKDGSISNVVPLKKMGWSLDEEAIRVVKCMPCWKPGKQNGKPVRVKITLPIVFRLK